MKKTNKKTTTDDSTKKILAQAEQMLKTQMEEENILRSAAAIKEKRGLKKNLVEGVFTDYYETGMEGCLGMCVQDRTKITPNHQYDPNDASKGPENWYSHAGLFFLKSGCVVRVYNKDNTLAYEGELTKNRSMMAEKGYRYSFLPMEVSTEEFFRWFKEELRVLLYTEERRDF